MQIQMVRSAVLSADEDPEPRRVNGHPDDWDAGPGPRLVRPISEYSVNQQEMNGERSTRTFCRVTRSTANGTPSADWPQARSYSRRSLPRCAKLAMSAEQRRQAQSTSACRTPQPKSILRKPRSTSQMDLNRNTAGSAAARDVPLPSPSLTPLSDANAPATHYRAAVKHCYAPNQADAGGCSSSSCRASTLTPPPPPPPHLYRSDLFSFSLEDEPSRLSLPTGELVRRRDDMVQAYLLQHLATLPRLRDLRDRELAPVPAHCPDAAAAAIAARRPQPQTTRARAFHSENSESLSESEAHYQRPHSQLLQHSQQRQQQQQHKRVVKITLPATEARAPNGTAVAPASQSADLHSIQMEETV